MRMKSADIEQAWQAITTIEAQQMLVDFQVSSYPHMNKKGQEKLHRRISKQAYPERFEAPANLTLKMIANIVNG